MKATTSDLIGARYQPQGVNLWLSPDFQRLLPPSKPLPNLPPNSNRPPGKKRMSD
jgi:hypothetical protein